ncbi:hypothetical protein [Alteromonas sp. C1M14]|uniref:hypothetical protein n=1 Tax=Alteromonas sp. C1M14 TaxID=2841567 RepID=UPI001C085C74|nr:hypothetical protein [Alteromonas sp. C1M14]MBU2980179.1 hypothetical protein [Alteromonas sp. C1M14]
MSLDYRYQAQLKPQWMNIIASSTSGSECTSAERMYSYVTDSSVRTEAYQNAIIQQPVRQSISIAWNNLIDVANISVSVGGVEVDLFKKETEVFFPDGGYMRVVNRPNVPQMAVIPGSALDCNGNSIPTTRDEVPGTYYHSTLAENENFREYVRSFGVGVRVNNKTCYTGPIQTKCMPSSKDPDKMECIAVIPECFY